jgi:hypothetical protein
LLPGIDDGTDGTASVAGKVASLTNLLVLGFQDGS